MLMQNVEGTAAQPAQAIPPDLRCTLFPFLQVQTRHNTVCYVQTDPMNLDEWGH